MRDARATGPRSEIDHISKGEKNGKRCRPPRPTSLMVEAIEIQRGMAEQNIDVPQVKRMFLQSRRMSPFRRPVSAAENSVPDSTFGDLVRSLRGGQPVWSRSSLRKPPFPESTPNRAFLRGFPTTHFPDFCLCERSPILVAIFGGLSPHPKIPFPAAGFGHKIRPHLQPQFCV